MQEEESQKWQEAKKALFEAARMLTNADLELAIHDNKVALEKLETERKRTRIMAKVVCLSADDVRALDEYMLRYPDILPRPR